MSAKDGNSSLEEQLRLSREDVKVGRKTIETLTETVKQLMVSNEALSKMVKIGNQGETTQFLLAELFDQMKDLKRKNKKQKDKIRSLEECVDEAKDVNKNLNVLENLVKANTDLCLKVKDDMVVEQNKLKVVMDLQNVDVHDWKEEFEETLTQIQERLEQVPDAAEVRNPPVKDVLKDFEETVKYQLISHRLTALEEDNMKYKLSLEAQKQEYTSKIKELEETIEKNNRMNIHRMKRTDEEYLSMDVALVQVMNEIDTKMEKIEKLMAPEKHYKCFKCKSYLAKSLRTDGVSVFCHKCKIANIVAELRSGHKWVYIESPIHKYGWCQHYQQVPVKDVVTERKCLFCETIGTCIGAAPNMAVLMTEKEVMEKKEREKLQTPAGLVEKMNDLESVVKGNTEIVKGRLVDLEEKHALLNKDMGHQAEKFKELKKTVEDNLINEAKTVAQESLPSADITSEDEESDDDCAIDQPIISQNLKNLIDKGFTVPTVKITYEPLRKVKIEKCQSPKETAAEALVQKKKEVDVKQENCALMCISCSTVLDSNYRRDGVSVACTNCHTENIVAPLKEGNKWVIVTAPKLPFGWCQHFMQIPRIIKNDDIIACRVCKTTGSVWEISSRVAKQVTEKNEK